VTTDPLHQMFAELRANKRPAETEIPAEDPQPKKPATAADLAGDWLRAMYAAKTTH
jgi:hypothetical protein